MPQASVSQGSTVTSNSISVQTLLTTELRAVNLLDGSLHLKTIEERENEQNIKKQSLNLAVLPLQTLHELHQGVTDEIKVQVQRDILVIKEVKKNQHMFYMKNKVVHDCNEATVHRQQLEKAITKACYELPELQIQTEEASEEKL